MTDLNKFCPYNTRTFKTRFNNYSTGLNTVSEIGIYFSFYQLFLFEVRVGFFHSCTFNIKLCTLHFTINIIRWIFLNNSEVSPLWTYSNYTLSHTQNGGVCSRRNMWAFLCKPSSWCALLHTEGRPSWLEFCVEVKKPPRLLITTPPVMWTSMEKNDWNC